MDYLELLNEQQRQAVLHTEGPLLILAGAGSGKTRVITNRIAYLIDRKGVNPYNILAITFTNKAAREMRERVDSLVGFGSENIWVSTFHSTCVRILRRFIESIGYDRSFTIYDADDSKSLMKAIIKDMNLDPKKFKEKTILNAISKAKDELIGPDVYALSFCSDYIQNTIAACYREYQSRLHRNNALDFDDLIMKTVELFKADKDALAYYQKRFRYIHVDEYQDTNTAQFELIRLLANTESEDGTILHNLCVVGDDDQSIYKFRGANIRNILDFEQNYPEAIVIKLEQNYRSTGNILNVANGVIANNLGRKQKSLWTENEDGDAISFTRYSTDYEEADGVISDIREKVDEEGFDYNDFAILYRTNAQSRLFEEKLILKNIPYRLVGGVNFYQRKEIKDILAYLRTINNGLDDIAVKRIINVPKRGIGLTTVDRLEEYARENDISLYEAIRRAAFIPSVSRSLTKLESFAALVEGFRSKLAASGYQLSEIIDDILNATGYFEEIYEEEEEEKADERKENIGELVNKLSLYVTENEPEATLAGFLEEVSLVGDIDSLDESEKRVILMTIHSAKGLEFPICYMVGMDDGIFPGMMSINAENPELEIEEERRLCYVGMTRAKKKLYLSSAEIRMVHGNTEYYKQSRFIKEIPRYLLTMKGAPSRDSFGKSRSFADEYGFGNKSKLFGDSYGIDSKYSKPAYDKRIGSSKQNSGSKPSRPYLDFLNAPAKDIGSGGEALSYEVGDAVKHFRFGQGIVKDIVKGGKDFEVTVEFSSGIKKMLASFAKLTKV